MLNRLRQIAFLVDDLPSAEEIYHRALGLTPVHHQDLPQYHLTNSVMPTGGETFLELLQPTAEDSSAGRFLARRGSAPYLLVFETHDFDNLIPHLQSLHIPITRITQETGYRSAFLHPSATNGAFVEIVEVTDPLNPWPPAGPNWQQQPTNPKTRQLRQIAVLVNDLDQAIDQWGRMFGLQSTRRFHISFTDLEIAVLPLQAQDTFIELAQPTSPDTSSARFLQRYGEGIYLTIFQIDDSLAVDAYLQTEEGIRFTTSRQTANYVNLGFNSIWLHPSSTKGAFIQLSQVLSETNPWPPAGDDWFQP